MANLQIYSTAEELRVGLAALNDNDLFIDNTTGRYLLNIRTTTPRGSHGSIQVHNYSAVVPQYPSIPEREILDFIGAGRLFGVAPSATDFDLYYYHGSGVTAKVSGDDIDDITVRINSLENTSTGAPDTTSGSVLEVTGQVGEQLSTSIETSVNNPAIKIFNASDSEFTFVSVHNNNLLSSSHSGYNTLTPRSTKILHHEGLGMTTLTFINISSEPTPGHIVIESAGG